MLTKPCPNVLPSKGTAWRLSRLMARKHPLKPKEQLLRPWPLDPSTLGVDQGIFQFNSTIIDNPFSHPPNPRNPPLAEEAVETSEQPCVAEDSGVAQVRGADLSHLNSEVDPWADVDGFVFEESDEEPPTPGALGAGFEGLDSFLG